MRRDSKTISYEKEKELGVLSVGRRSTAMFSLAAIWH